MLEYLRKYDKSVEIVNINDIDKTAIPEYWTSVLTIDGTRFHKLSYQEYVLKTCKFNGCRK